jgi:dihydrolipoamide dehydrogenase
MTRIVVLGGGPAGYVAALRAAQLGATVTMVEAREIGGTCLNRGCIPTKAMVAAAERLRAARNDAGFGVVTGAPRVDFAALTARKRAVTVELRGGVEHMLKQRKVEVLAGHGRLIDPHTVEAQTAAGETLRAAGDALIIASGSRPTLPRAFGVDDPRVLTSDGLLELDHVPDSLAIVGGGVIGCEFASIFAELGSRVTVVEMLDQLIPGEDRRAASALQQSFRKAGIETRLKSAVERLDPSSSDGVSLLLADGSTVEAHYVLIAVGRSPVSRDLGYEDAGVALDEHGFVVADETLRTAVDGVFAAGDVAGPPLLAHWAYAQGAAAAENAVLGGRRAVDRRFVPNCIFSHPEVASFGMSEADARAANLPVEIAQVRFNGNSKAVIEGENDGYIRVVADAGDGRVLGASLVGPRVTDLVHELVLAAQAGLTLAAIADAIHAHPTLSEGIGEAALRALGRGMHTL